LRTFSERNWQTFKKRYKNIFKRYRRTFQERLARSTHVHYQNVR